MIARCDVTVHAIAAKFVAVITKPSTGRAHQNQASRGTGTPAPEQSSVNDEGRCHILHHFPLP